MKSIWIRFLAALPRAGTTVVIADGRARVRRGRASPRLLGELAQLCEEHGVADALVCASGPAESGGRLSFRGIPRRLHQRFRNAWVANRR